MFDSRVNLLLIAMTVSFATTLAQAVDSPDVDAAIKELESKAEDRIAKAVAKLRNSAEGGNVKAMSNLAWHYYKKGDYTTAHTWYEKTVAADPTDSHAMYTLGVMYRLGRGVKRDFAKAMEWFRKSADKKNGSAMGKLGLMYARGESVKKDFVMAATWARKGAEIGSPTAMYVYGWALHNGEGVKEDKATGLDWLQKGATKGNKNAMEYVGKHHYKAREYDQAKKWYEKALASGSTTLQVMQEFATIHLEGRGVKQDYAKAMKWFRKAADGGDAISMSEIAFMYEGGKGMKRDPHLAAAWAGKAAKKNNKNAMYLYGYLLHEGDGVEKNTKAGIEWMQKAAKLGHRFAKERLAKLGATREPKPKPPTPVTTPPVVTVPKPKPKPKPIPTLPEGPVPVAKASAFTDNGEFLFPVNVDGKHGFIDPKGKLVVKLEYDAAGEFSEGVAPVKKGDKWGAVDSSGRVVVPFDFDHLSKCSDGCIAAHVNRQYGYVDRKGKWIIAQYFSHTSPFENGVANVTVNDKSGWLRRDGTWVRRPEYAEVTYFGEGRGMAKVGDKWGLANEKGEWVVEPRFELVRGYHRFTDGLMPVGQAGKWSFIGRDGKWLVEPQFDAVGRPLNGYCPIKKGKLWGLMDRTGKVVVTPTYPDITVPTEGLSQITREGLTGGFLDIKSDVEVIEPRYRECYAFEDGLAWVKDSNGDHFYINKTGSVVHGPFEEANHKFDHGLAQVKEGSITRVIDRKGMTIWQHGEMRGSKPNLYAAIKLHNDLKRFSKGTRKTMLRNYGSRFRAEDTAHKALAGALLYKGGLLDFHRSDSSLNAAIAGNSVESHAMFLLGRMYAEGNGVKKDLKMAAKLYRRAAGLGHSDAMREFGQLHRAYVGIRKDPIIRGNWARMAAERGSAAGMHDYALLLNDGVSINKDEEAAIEWWKKAMRGGHQEARTQLKRLGVVKYPQRFGITVDFKKGFIDANGKIVITPQYLFAPRFKDGLSTVSRHLYEAGAIDPDGRVVIPFDFSQVHSFNEGLAPARDKKTKKWGFIDRQGKWVIKPAYDYCGFFHEGFAIVESSENNKTLMGYIKSDGTFLVPPGPFLELEPFEDGLGWVKVRKPTGNWGVIDKTGRWIFQPLFDAPGGRTQNGRFVVKLKGKWGVISRLGHPMVPTRYERIIENSDSNLLAVREGDKWGFVTANGEWVIKPQFGDWSRFFGDGYAAVKKGNNWGMINAEGKIVIEPMYESLWPPTEGLARFMKDKMYGYLDPATGRVLLPNKYRSAGSFSGGVASISNTDGKDKDYYLIDRYGLIVGGPFKDVDTFGAKEGLMHVEFMTSSGPMRGYANNKGKIVWQTVKKKRSHFPTARVFNDYMAAKKDLRNNVNVLKAIAILNAQVKNGNANAMLDLGYYHYRQLDYGKARDLYEEALTYNIRTYGTSETILGHIYKNGGKGVKADKQKAKTLYIQGALKGNPNGMSGLGWMYYKNATVPAIDYPNAAKWGRMAAEKNNRDGMYLYGLLLYRGHGVPKADQKAGIEWMQKAARKEHIYAQKSLKELGIKW